MGEGMMKPVELRFCNQDEANVLLSKNDEMWAPHGNPILDGNNVVKIALVKTIPIRFNVRNESNLVVPQVRVN